MIDLKGDKHASSEELYIGNCAFQQAEGSFQESFIKSGYQHWPAQVQQDLQIFTAAYSTIIFSTYATHKS